MARPANPGLRDEIVKAAAFIIEDCGPDCVTMREVAEQIGYSPTTIYNHFKDKSDVLRAAVHAAFADLADACDAASVGPRSVDMLRQRSRAYIVWGIMHPGHYRLMFEYSEEIQFNDEDIALMGRVLSWQRELVDQAVARGELRPECDSVRIARALWSALHGSTSLALARRLELGAESASGPDTVQLATDASDLLVDGLLDRFA